MAFRPLLYIGDTVCKCVFKPAQFKLKLRTVEVYKEIRNFGHLRGRTKLYRPSPPGESSKLWKPFAFTLIFSGTTFTVATICEYESIREKTYKTINHYRQLRIHRTGWRHEMEVWWNNLSTADRVFAPICFLNLMVFLAWRIPMFKKTMLQYFCSSPVSRAVCWSMVLSTFSHVSILHLASNMYALYSFCFLAVSSLGTEQFVALYLTSGVVSSFVSILYKTAIGQLNPSLGASGAVMGIIGYVCSHDPNVKLAVMFLPMVTMTAGTGIQAIMGIDILGCIMRWTFFDHAAHLGGALFGMFWQAWGNAYIWQNRGPIFRFWHKLRKPPGSP